jgi:hypothetical protein
VSEIIGFLDDTDPPWEHPELQCPECDGTGWLIANDDCDDEDVVLCPRCWGEGW